MNIYTDFEKNLKKQINKDIHKETKGDIPLKDNLKAGYIYTGWITVVVIAIKNYDQLILSDEPIKVRKVLSYYLSVLCEIFTSDEKLLDLNFFDGMIYAVYTSNSQFDDYHLFLKTITLNTLNQLFNEILNKEQIIEFEFSIAIDTGINRVFEIKTNSNESYINFIGSTIKNTKKLIMCDDSRMGIMVSSNIFDNIKEIVIDRDKKPIEWFIEKHDQNGDYYSCNLYSNYIYDLMKNK